MNATKFDNTLQSIFESKLNWIVYNYEDIRATLLEQKLSISIYKILETLSCLEEVRWRLYGNIRMPHSA